MVRVHDEVPPDVCSWQVWLLARSGLPSFHPLWTSRWWRGSAPRRQWEGWASLQRWHHPTFSLHLKIRRTLQDKFCTRMVRKKKKEEIITGTGAYGCTFHRHILITFWPLCRWGRCWQLKKIGSWIGKDALLFIVQSSAYPCIMVCSQITTLATESFQLSCLSHGINILDITSYDSNVHLGGIFYLKGASNSALQLHLCRHARMQCH